MREIVIENLSLRYDVKEVKSTSIKKYMFESFLDKNFSENYIYALEKINLKIKENTILGLYGPNGSGKSSLLKIIAQINKPTSGKIQVPFSSSFLGSSNFSFIESATGEENALLYLNLKGIKKPLQLNLIKKIFSISKLGKFFHQPVKIYSSGMMLRLAFACTEVISSEVLILDEWISTADEEMREYISNTIKNKIKKSLITIIASHDYSLLERNCDRIILLKNGKIDNET
tara:strand:+ start:393 stop:1085 length:693 start_codon:yes stop_codon:yes gene_type:complete